MCFKVKGTILYWSTTHYIMRTLFIFKLIVLMLLSFGLSDLKAQEIRTNAKGEKIIVYPDGSWKYFSKKSKVDPFGANPVANSNVAGAKDKQKASTINDNTFQYLVELSEEALIIRRSLLERIDVEGDKYKSLRQKQQEHLDGLVVLTNKELGILNRQLYKADLTESLNLNRLDLAEQLVALTNAMQEVEKVERAELYQTYLETKESYKTLINQEIIFEDQVQIKSELDQKIDKEDNSFSSGNCQFAFEGTDPITGKFRRTMEPDFLFSFTPENLRAYFTEDDMINCTASITELGGGKVFLLLEVKIKSPNAKNSYGGIGRSSILTLKTFDDDQIRLVCSLGDEGHYNDINNVYTFRGQYPISKGELKVLRRSEVDRARIVWKTGYEDYDILNVDFFINQFNCLK